VDRSGSRWHRWNAGPFDPSTEPTAILDRKKTAGDFGRHLVGGVIPMPLTNRRRFREDAGSRGGSRCERRVSVGFLGPARRLFGT
jgi:hypothetical protein